MFAPEPVPDVVRRQISELRLASDRPLVISDADEVILQFIRALETYLGEQELYLDLKSFALTGNIRRQGDGVALEASAVKSLLGQFFEHRVDTVEAVDGAREALEIISEKAQIVVLSNLPLERREARQKGLRRQGMNYPLVANSGPKGGAVRLLADAVQAPIFFLDDLPGNIKSVAEAASEVIRVHFVADPRLARLLEPAEYCHVRLDNWPAARAYIEAHLGADA